MISDPFVMMEITTFKDVLKMSYDRLLIITTATLEDDMVIIVDTPEIAMEMMSKSQNENTITLG